MLRFISNYIYGEEDQVLRDSHGEERLHNDRDEDWVLVDKREVLCPQGSPTPLDQNLVKSRSHLKSPNTSPSESFVICLDNNNDETAVDDGTGSTCSSTAGPDRENEENSPPSADRQGPLLGDRGRQRRLRRVADVSLQVQLQQRQKYINCRHPVCQHTMSKPGKRRNQKQMPSVRASVRNDRRAHFQREF